MNCEKVSIMFCITAISMNVAMKLKKNSNSFDDDIQIVERFLH
jgi:hypothetical protein